MLSAFDDFVPKRGIKRFRIDRGVEMQMIEAMLPGDALDLPHERRANACTGRPGGDVAGPQLCVLAHEATQADNRSIDLRHQPDLLILVLDKAAKVFLSHGHDPRLDHFWRVVRRGKTTNGTSVDLEERARLAGQHGANDNGHDGCALMLSPSCSVHDRSQDPLRAPV